VEVNGHVESAGLVWAPKGWDVKRLTDVMSCSIHLSEGLPLWVMKTCVSVSWHAALPQLVILEW
jgi:hypothetical protein